MREVSLVAKSTTIHIYHVGHIGIINSQLSSVFSQIRQKTALSHVRHDDKRLVPTDCHSQEFHDIRVVKPSHDLTLLHKLVEITGTEDSCIKREN